MDHFSDLGDKGQYCRFVRQANGEYILAPVKVPAHVIAAREERIRRRELQRQIEENRRRAQALNRRSLISLTFAIAVFAMICCMFLYLQTRVSGRMSAVAALQAQLETLTEENDILEQHLQSSVNLETIAETASQKFGMQTVQAGQIYYYSDDGQSDYMLQLEDVE